MHSSHSSNRVWDVRALTTDAILESIPIATIALRRRDVKEMNLGDAAGLIETFHELSIDYIGVAGAVADAYLESE